MTKYAFNMFISIKNSQKSKKSSVNVYRKNLCEAFLKLLWNEGFIAGYKTVSSDNKKLEVFLKYSDTGNPIINSIKFVSKPSRRIYFSIKQIWKLDSTKTFIIFSTTHGLMSINDCKKNKIGGEPLVIVN
nr:ribosomal protein S8 [Nitzschia traheaformis]